MALCAYCDCSGVMTREHVWSSVVLDVFRDVAPKTFDHKRERVHDADPQIRDTCTACNNVKLSPVDSFAGSFAKQFLKDDAPLGELLPLSNNLMWRWVTKTVYNLDRANKNSIEWALPLRPFMLGDAPRPQSMDLFFAAWRDLSPAGVALPLNIVLTLDAKRPMLDFLDSVSGETLSERVEQAAAVKVGYGVFLLLVWRDSDAARDAIGVELKVHGWRGASQDGIPEHIPFDVITSAQFQFLCPSQKCARRFLNRG